MYKSALDLTVPSAAERQHADQQQTVGPSTAPNPWFHDHSAPHDGLTTRRDKRANVHFPLTIDMLAAFAEDAARLGSAPRDAPPPILDSQTPISADLHFSRSLAHLSSADRDVAIQRTSTTASALPGAKVTKPAEAEASMIED